MYSFISGTKRNLYGSGVGAPTTLHRQIGMKALKPKANKPDRHHPQGCLICKGRPQDEEPDGGNQSIIKQLKKTKS